MRYYKVPSQDGRWLPLQLIDSETTDASVAVLFPGAVPSTAEECAALKREASAGAAAPVAETRADVALRLINVALDSLRRGTDECGRIYEDYAASITANLQKAAGLLAWQE